MGKNADNRVKKQIGTPAIIGAITGLIVLLGIFYFIFLRPSEPATSQGSQGPPPDAVNTGTATGGAPNMPQPPPGDTDKEHVGPDTSGSSR